MSEEISRFERRITSYDGDITRRQDTRVDRFSITLGYQTLTDQGIAGKMLLRVGKRLKVLTGVRRSGFFAGFYLLLLPLFSCEIKLEVRWHPHPLPRASGHRPPHHPEVGTRGQKLRRHQRSVGRAPRATLVATREFPSAG